MARCGHQVLSHADNGRGGRSREGCAETFTVHNIAGKRGQNSICTSLGRGPGGSSIAAAVKVGRGKQIRNKQVVAMLPVGVPGPAGPAAPG